MQCAKREINWKEGIVSHFKVVQYCRKFRKIYQNILGNYEGWCSKRKETIVWTHRMINQEMLRWSQRGKERPTYN